MEMHLTQAGPVRTGPMNPPGVQPASVEAWQALVAPGDVFRHPREVLAHPNLSRTEKRAILASWASDACALENAPGLRCLAGSRAEPVPVDAVLGALAELDDEAPRGSGTRPTRRLSPRRRSRTAWTIGWHLRPGRRNDDDDDPPPCPATIMPAPRPRTFPDAAARALCIPA
ncbi:hypothetical protein [Methylobacterium tarhaniae]|nr:hypothetical protein [Methylobacterium tarhaniae]